MNILLLLKLYLCILCTVRQLIKFDVSVCVEASALLPLYKSTNFLNISAIGDERPTIKGYSQAVNCMERDLTQSLDRCLNKLQLVSQRNILSFFFSYLEFCSAVFFFFLLAPHIDLTSTSPRSKGSPFLLVMNQN